MSQTSPCEVQDDIIIINNIILSFVVLLTWFYNAIYIIQEWSKIISNFMGVLTQ